jgi:hypothetical protein
MVLLTVWPPRELDTYVSPIVALRLLALDFLVVPTVTFRLLYLLVFLSHQRRQVVHFNATAHPTADWTAQQLVEAFPGWMVAAFLNF